MVPHPILYTKTAYGWRVCEKGEVIYFRVEREADVSMTKNQFWIVIKL
jgi:hypothetical protein